MLRFVILHHRTPPQATKPDHYDLMLEEGDVLKTFTLWQLPDLKATVEAIPDFDHRRAYLDYEGPVSNNRGEVMQVESGTFVWKRRTANQIEIELSGKQVRGLLRLEIQGDSTAGASSDSATSD